MHYHLFWDRQPSKTEKTEFFPLAQTALSISPRVTQNKEQRKALNVVPFDSCIQSTKQDMPYIWYTKVQRFFLFSITGKCYFGTIQENVCFCLDNLTCHKVCFSTFPCFSSPCCQLVVVTEAECQLWFLNLTSKRAYRDSGKVNTSIFVSITPRKSLLISLLVMGLFPPPHILSPNESYLL